MPSSTTEMGLLGNFLRDSDLPATDQYAITPPV